VPRSEYHQGFGSWIDYELGSKFRLVHDGDERLIFFNFSERLLSCCSTTTTTTCLFRRPRLTTLSLSLVIRFFFGLVHEASCVPTFCGEQGKEEESYAFYAPHFLRVQAKQSTETG
jgi:hypothetical protein